MRLHNVLLTLLLLVASTTVRSRVLGAISALSQILRALLSLNAKVVVANESKGIQTREIDTNQAGLFS